MSRTDDVPPVRFEQLVIEWWRAYRSERLPHTAVEIKVLQVRGKPHRVQVYVSPTGRSVRVFLNGRELK